MISLRCRGCGAIVTETLIDLGMQPLSNAFVAAADLSKPETFYPLHPMVCERCFLVQLDVFESPERIFSDYAYFSSFSTSWLEHSSQHATSSIERLGLSPSSFCVEVASNDGYLLKSFVAAGIRVLGIEPAANVAEVARQAGIPTAVAFFGAATAAKLSAEHGRADMMVANNVLAHVPDIHDFLEGFRIMLAPNGVATFEFPHLVPLIEEVQFDTIYHEHFSYLSLVALEPVLAAHGLRVIDVERLTTHGGSLRLWVAHEQGSATVTARVRDVRDVERAAKLDDVGTYRAFRDRVRVVKARLLEFLIGCSERGDRIVAYGAAAKGNTLLNYCGIRADLVEFAVDRNPHKQDMFLPGSRIAVKAVDALLNERPAYVLILPWNLRTEISEQLSSIRTWGGKFVVAIPSLEVF